LLWIILILGLLLVATIFLGLLFFMYMRRRKYDIKRRSATKL
jgi:hypothetical protein